MDPLEIGMVLTGIDQLWVADIAYTAPSTGAAPAGTWGGAAFRIAQFIDEVYNQKRVVNQADQVEVVGRCPVLGLIQRIGSSPKLVRRRHFLRRSTSPRGWGYAPAKKRAPEFQRATSHLGNGPSS
jgi:hypothetical protein